MNYRNYERLALEFSSGFVLIEGDNGHGKSNLLEAVHMLAVSKSSRALFDQELVRDQIDKAQVHTQISATAHRFAGSVRVQIDLVGTEKKSSDAGVFDSESMPGHKAALRLDIKKDVRVNGVRRKAFEAVGEINAVLFTAQDLDLIFGSPSIRRRYMDILISQIDSNYLIALRRFRRVLAQRNSLLKSVRAGYSHEEELDYWDKELTDSGGLLMSCRAETLQSISSIAAPIYKTLATHDDELNLVYRPTVRISSGTTEIQAGLLLEESIRANRDRELVEGVTLIGPHRDDLNIFLGHREVARYASRGQCRTVVLALRLAEASFFKDKRGDEPIVLLDDVLSELDIARRTKVLDFVSNYEQILLTATDAENVGESRISGMSRYRVENGNLFPFLASGDN